MHVFWNGLVGLLALLWILLAVRVGRGISRMPRLADFPPLPDEHCPRVSIVFAARDEADKLADALQTMLALDYPYVQIVAVDDRSADATAELLDDFARQNPSLRVIHVTSLPEGWLGKPHALHRGFTQSSSDWLLFTDADVHFAPDLLRRAVALAESLGWDHLTLLGCPFMVGFWEKTVLTFLGLGFSIGTEPWEAADPHSHRYIGVGSFQLIRRSVYEAVGTHKRLAMEVIDDMKLGKLVKEAGFRSGAGLAGESIRLRWHAGLRNLIHGATKNFFAASGFRLSIALIQIVGLLVVDVLPFAALFFGGGLARGVAVIAAGIPVAAQVGVALEFGVSPLYALTHPLGALIFAWMLARSAAVTLWRHGIVWRGTFYPLEDLRKGIV